MTPLFRDRTDAGRALGASLAHHAGRDDVVVLALPRGGVPVAYEVAQALGAPLDVFVVRKLGVPGHEELAMGAIASGGVLVRNEPVVRALNLDDTTIGEVAEAEQRELRRREEAYRGQRESADVTGKVVILVDDGLATGSTMRAAVAAVRRHAPVRIVVAVPTGAHPTCVELGKEVDEIVCVETPSPFHAVGQSYRDFSQTSDDQVRELLERSSRLHSPPP